MGITITYSGGQLTGSDLYFEDFKLSEALCDAEQLTLGSCISSKIRFTISNKVASLNRKDLTVNLNGEQLGIFRVYADTPDANSPNRKVTAYDAIYRINNAQIAEWYLGLFLTDESTVTLKQFRDSFFAHFGVTQENVTLVNDAMVIRKSIDPQTLYGREVIRAICEINGVFGHINKSGVFEYVSLPANNAAATAIPASEVEALHYETYTAQAIDKIVIRGSETEAGASYGSGSNAYFITGNILALGATGAELATIAQRISTKIFGIAYIPFTAEVSGMRNTVLGKRVSVAGADITLAGSIVLEHELSGILSPHSTIAAQGREEWREEKEDDELISDYRVLTRKTNELIRTVDGTISRVTEVEKGLEEAQTTITQLPHSIELTASETTTPGGVPQKATVTISVKDGQGQVATDSAEISFNGLVTFTNEQIDKVSIGGRNLLSNSKDLDGYIIREYLINEAGLRLRDGTAQLYV